MEIKIKTVEAIKNRSESAFMEVYDKYHKLVKHVIYHMVYDHEISDELVQETFMKMYEKIDTYTFDSNFKYWLLQIAKNLTYDYLRKQKKQLNVEKNDLLIEEAMAIDSKPVSNLMSEVEKIIDAESYQILIYKLYHHLKFHEIADLLGTTTSVVNNKYQRAIKKLKRELNAEDVYE